MSATANVDWRRSKVQRKASTMLAALAVGAVLLSGLSTPATATSTTVRPEAATPSTIRTPVWYPDWTPDGGMGEARSWPAAWPKPVQLEPRAKGPLSGRTILIDPGHNRGNFSHVRQINRHYWVGLDKICNTTGTETHGGLLEATYTWDVARRLTRLLRDAGARVVLTRDSNSRDTYGPCIQARGLLGGQLGADIGVSIHADGGPSSGRGAFVYTPARKSGYTSRTKARRSVRLATSILDGLASNGLGGSTYLRPNVAPDRMQGTLNVSTIPIVIVETLNMHNSDDAAIAESAEGRQQVAAGLYSGIAGYFGVK